MSHHLFVRLLSFLLLLLFSTTVCSPVFVIPGDNDILDCENLDEGLEFWRDEFQGFDSRHWDHDFELQRQPGREENFSFVHKNTLFIALNMVSGENLRSWFSWSERLDDQFRWTRRLIRRYSKTKTDVGRIVIFAHANPTGFHDEFFDPLRRFVIDELENSIPMLYLNGDGHEWYYEPSFLDQKSLLRIMVTGGTTEPPLKVTVNANGKNLKPSRAYKHDRRLD